MPSIQLRVDQAAIYIPRSIGLMRQPKRENVDRFPRQAYAKKISLPRIGEIPSSTMRRELAPQQGQEAADGRPCKRC
jgi:methylphosphotriester-DNA--protein-cysteine methyltransferase